MDRSTKTRMKALLTELDYDFSRFTLDGFARWLAKRRGQPIVFVPWEMPPSLFGAWIASDGRDYIFFDRDTQPIHQTHIKLHEMAHILCDHPTARVESEQALLVADPTVSKALLRSTHSDQEEQEAETLATLIQEQILRHAARQRDIDGVSWDRDFAKSFSSYLGTVELD